MNNLLIILSFIAVIFTASPSEALTIQNTCKYPVAGSVTIADSMVSVAQFRLIPGEKKKFLGGFEKMKLIIRTIPDVYNLEKLKITSTEIDSPNNLIMLKQSPDGIRYKVE
ncbi:hypothetical protein [Maridesulfovibrio sp.]|uniref:hypothetical protein n=1 Tax=Maridesulfovibrio sp. TaxID=2795000 RepID=UPI0029CA8515|nr:hypothetical protein [Maridesulfovibrio sp.]